MTNRFGPDYPYETLNPVFKACLYPNEPTLACDRLVGSLEAGQGFCGPNSGYADNTYCACVNNKIPCPMSAAAACANSNFSYKPTTMLEGGAEWKSCQGHPICVNLAEVGGRENVVSGVVQQCGPVQNFTNAITANPALAIFAFILLIALIILVVVPPASSAGAGSSRPVAAKLE